MIEKFIGTYVARGNASKNFSPFLRPKDVKGSLDVLKKKLMVDFDPLQCYLLDLQVSVPVAVFVALDIFDCVPSPFFFICTGRVPKHVQSVV